ncbi:hypothetical protein EG327_007538 [Venturia inaequalis]|uniref:Polyketide synthase n=1 Tax=Venturia inaequalis TaxID=5025 RepID=A0A8H3UZB3_VENIN|nr:hypothetical protein EG327_007538 [Venturia inaequalis]
MATQNDKQYGHLVAICGIGLRLPGGVDDGDSFWNLLVRKEEARCPIPAKRFNIDNYYSETTKPGMVAMKHGYFLDDANLAHFDAAFFSMTAREVERLDPQQRLLLEVVRECLENAGETKWRGSETACMVGTFGADWGDMQGADKMTGGLYNITGQGDFLLSNRVSYEYDLKGESFTVKTGCSAALIGVHLACQAILRGDCSAAIAGGTNLILAPGMSIAMTEQGIVSPEGRSKTFDATADGYGRGEAINCVYLKRVEDALRDGNPIRAVIRSTASNSDGKSANISTPSSEAHEQLIRKAYEKAGLSSRIGETPFIECHGTGTAVGDPLEAAAVAKVFGHSGVYLGSVKPNVGHSEGASGITSLIKAVLSLENKTIPPNINFSQPNPRIPFKEAKLTVPVDSVAWPPDRPERISVNSFGLGGANVHLILESPQSLGIYPASSNARFSPGGIESLGHGHQKHNEGPSPGGSDDDSTSMDYEASTPASSVDFSPLIYGDDQFTDSSRPRLLTLSANHPDSLLAITEKYQTYIRRHPNRLGDLEYTLLHKRENLRHRAFCVLVGDSEAEPVFTQSTAAPAHTPEVTFVFTGQGAQWPEMGASLAARFPSFLRDLRSMDEALANELFKPKETSSVEKSEYSQPLCTAIQIGIVNLWSNLGLTPSAVIGHSSGEIAAAYAAGSLTAYDAIIIAYLRGKSTTALRREGSMAAIGLGSIEVREYLETNAVVACENSSTSTTISGDVDAVAKTIEKIKSALPDTFARLLKVERAYHSFHMEAIAPIYFQSIERYTQSQLPRIPFFSSVTGEKLDTADGLDAHYWTQNLVRPVLFSTALAKLVEEPGLTKTLFLEVGPHAALAGPIRQTCRELNSKNEYVSSLIRLEGSYQAFLRAVGQLHCQKLPLNMHCISSGGRVLTDLPHYQWHHDTDFWEESRISKEWRMRRAAPHDLLGLPILEWNDLEPTWRNILRLEEMPWISGHMIGPDVVLPGAGYICMAGEASRQLTGSTSYIVRNVVIGAAMVLNDTEPREVMTVLRKKRLNNNLESHAYEFEVTSTTKDASWTRHCWGEVEPCKDTPASTEAAAHTFSRPVDSKKWYKTLSEIGLKYTGVFQGLQEVKTSPNRDAATATIHNVLTPAESRYPMHPSTIDLVFQLFSVAGTRGLSYNLDSLSVPTFIEELYVGSFVPTMQVEVNSDVHALGTFSGNAHGFANGNIVFKLRGLKSSPLDNDRPLTKDSHAAVQVEWNSSYEFMDPKSLMCPVKDYRELVQDLEELFLLCAVVCLKKVEGPSTKQEYLNKLYKWLQGYVGQAKSEQPAILQPFIAVLDLDAHEQEARIHTIYTRMLDTDAKSCAIAIHRNCTYFKEIFEGSMEPLDILMEDNVLTEMYNFLGFWDYTKFFNALGHKEPTMRILEIGAGTGGTTAAILQGLRSKFGERMYSTYTYTDVSAGFFRAAKERFAAYENIDYTVFDVSDNPCDQGIEEGSYDLVVAANVLHATPCLSQTLKNVRKLLRPGGQLLLQELCPEFKWMNFIVGTLPGWWLGAADGRPDAPYVSPSRWADELESAGFCSDPAVIYDNLAPFQINANIIAKAAVEPVKALDKVVLLYRERINENARQCEKALAGCGISTEWCELWQDLPVETHVVVSLLDIDAPFMATATQDSFGRFTAIVNTINKNRQSVVWVTDACQVRCNNPDYAEIIGYARNLRSEMLMDISTVEMADLAKGLTDFVPLAKICANLPFRRGTKDLDFDYEYAVSNGEIQTPRFHWISVNDELKQLSASQQSHAKLVIGKRGAFKTLHYESAETVALLPDEVRVQVKATGLNFKDVLIAMGVIDENVLGLEAAGVVLETGSGVDHVQTGDNVAVFWKSCLATEVVTNSSLCVKMAPNLRFDEAATMLCTYATVIRSLIDVGRLEKDQTILIHSACGGVGIAAINIAQMIGAKIYATVGSKAKRLHLQNEYGIEPSCIFNSRNSTFVQGLQTVTEGRGVDMVLNSLSGELLHASWGCVAEFGTFIELGKRDLIGRATLEMHPFNENRSYIGVDLARIAADRPHLIRGLLERAMQWYSEGKIKPITPITLFPAAEAEAGFRYMQSGKHLGKIVFDFGDASKSLTPALQAPKMRLRSDATYLLPGGLGGVGRSVARWMVLHGARSLAFLSRSGRNESNDAYLNELEDMNCSVTVVQGSTADPAAVDRLIAEAPLPIAGVLQMSMVLRDCATSKMTFDHWSDVVGPRVQGTWNLHNALARTGAKLDFFVLFSSFCGLVGQWGQANYAASNTFLDAFVQFRHGLGLPASAIDIGALEDVGYVSESSEVLERFQSLNSQLLREKDLLDSLQLAIARSSPASADCSNSSAHCSAFTEPGVFGIGLRSLIPLSDPSCRLIWKRDARMSIYRNLEATASVAITSGSGDSLRTFLQTVSDTPSILKDNASVQTLAKEINETMMGFLMRSGSEDMDLNISFTDLGMDSLVSIELRNWLRQRLSYETTVLQIMSSSPMKLAEAVRDSLMIKYGVVVVAKKDNGVGRTSEEERKKWAEDLKYKAP